MLQEYRNKKIERVRIFEEGRSEKDKNGGQLKKERFTKGRHKKRRYTRNKTKEDMRKAKIDMLKKMI